MSGYIYLGVFIFVTLLASISSLIISKKVFYKEMSKSLKLDISVEQMEKSERNIEEFFKSKNLARDASAWTISEVLHVKIGKDDPRIVGQAYISEPNPEGNMTVTFREGVPYEQRKFILAHECAHIINGDPLPNARPDGKNKSPTEQLADYTAAAILMPIERVYYYLQDNNYENLTAKKRSVVIKKLCREFEVTPIIALRRVKEVYELEKSGVLRLG